MKKPTLTAIAIILFIANVYSQVHYKKTLEFEWREWMEPLVNVNDTLIFTTNIFQQSPKYIKSSALVAVDTLGNILKYKINEHNDSTYDYTFRYNNIIFHNNEIITTYFNANRREYSIQRFDRDFNLIQSKHIPVDPEIVAFFIVAPYLDGFIVAGSMTYFINNKPINRTRYIRLDNELNIYGII